MKIKCEELVKRNNDLEAISIKKQISDSSDINFILEYQKLDIEHKKIQSQLEKEIINKNKE